MMMMMMMWHCFMPARNHKINNKHSIFLYGSYAILTGRHSRHPRPIGQNGPDYWPHITCLIVCLGF